MGRSFQKSREGVTVTATLIWITGLVSSTLLTVSGLDSATEGAYSATVAVEAGKELGVMVIFCPCLCSEHADNINEISIKRSNKFLIVIRLSCTSKNRLAFELAHNETVEKPLVRKMFIKISHNKLKKCKNVAKILCVT
jgi:hypothetical protein